MEEKRRRFNEGRMSRNHLIFYQLPTLSSSPSPPSTDFTSQVLQNRKKKKEDKDDQAYDASRLQDNLEVHDNRRFFKRCKMFSTNAENTEIEIETMLKLEFLGEVR